MATFINLLILFGLYMLGCTLAFITFTLAMYKETGKLEKPVIAECILMSMLSWISFMVSLFFIIELTIQRNEKNKKNNNINE